MSWSKKPYLAVVSVAVLASTLSACGRGSDTASSDTLSATLIISTLNNPHTDS